MAKPYLLAPHVNPDRQRFKPLVDAWITELIDADIARGFGQQDFPTGDVTDSVKRLVPALNRSGFDVYQGGGNVFHVKYRKAGPIVVHMRPLAQRVIRPLFMEEA